jgi:Ca2+-transporting ATPase
MAIKGPDFHQKKHTGTKRVDSKRFRSWQDLSTLDKHTLVKHLRTMHDEVVAVTGDGTNDASNFT